MTEEVYRDGVEAHQGREFEELVENKRREVSAEVRRVVDGNVGKLFRKYVKEEALRGLGRSTSQSSSQGKSPARVPWNLPVALCL